MIDMPKETKLSYAFLYGITPIEEIHLIDKISLWMPIMRHYGLILLIEVVISNSRKIIGHKEIEICKIIRKHKISLVNDILM